ncbi:hypothetical protein C9374_000284 [Naegleria lovaniensis]|uniref:mitogen-activated protein kinase kinase n=1 Tax=Naegleria lovaniensis TaxID=51637 RepID=A0AA88GXI5_NAELO|nr:uncharacterized protein C9374_000284 [Naegleria lovaniensis]KAG2388845.1 hypothetical protein C9374_000284 [Naegleria lovaniensis]
MQESGQQQQAVESTTTTPRSKKPKKNKPTNLILTPTIEENSAISIEVIKKAEETYVDEAVKINDGRFRFGDQIEIGQDGIYSMMTQETFETESSMLEVPDNSSITTVNSPSTASTFYLNPDQHMQYEDLQEVCKLGRGASATVSKVVNKKTNQVYAMKRINVDLQDQKPKLIVSEFKALYNCECPYVMTLYDAYYRQGCIFMILEFMDCGSLEDILKTVGKIPEVILSRMCEQMLIGLNYLHTVKKIVHRDIKPANVLVHSSGRVCIADFGMSGMAKSQKYVQAIQQTAKWETFCGTYVYMSPERIKGQPHSYDSDIWAFGLTVAEMFLGFFPFILSSSSTIWDMINHLEKTNEAPFPLEGASDDFKDFVYSTLRFHRKERPSAASLLSHPFITKYKHKKPSFVEKWLYYSYIIPKQLAKGKTMMKAEQDGVHSCEDLLIKDTLTNAE